MIMLLLTNVVPAADLSRIAAELADASWKDGASTAGAMAREVKRNLQARGVQRLETFVADALRRHPIFEMAARPRKLSRIMFSRYQPGMEYGPHTDDALMGEEADPLRTDLAFTLFLSDPATYDGGALIVDGAAGEQAVKLAAGDCVLYPAGSIHRVEPVTRGERLAAVGWVQSVVRDAARREVLFDLANARARMQAPREDLLLLDKSIGGLLRMWSEP
jgi:PKHD-type hydroxylase